MDTIVNSAQEVLGSVAVSVVDSARFVRNILDAKPSDSKLTDAQFILKVIEVGLRSIRVKEMRSTSKIVEWWKKKRAKRIKNVLQCPMC